MGASAWLCFSFVFIRDLLCEKTFFSRIPCSEGYEHWLCFQESMDFLVFIVFATYLAAKAVWVLSQTRGRSTCFLRFPAIRDMREYIVPSG